MRAAKLRSDPRRAKTVPLKPVAEPSKDIWSRAEVGYTPPRDVRLHELVADWSRAEVGYTPALIDVFLPELQIGRGLRLVTLGW